MASSNLGNFAAGITLLHNDNNYLLKNSCAVFSSSSFPLILCRINVFLLSLHVSSCFNESHQPPSPLFYRHLSYPDSICLSLIIFYKHIYLYIYTHKTTKAKTLIHKIFGMNPFFYSSLCTGRYAGTGESDIFTHPSGFSSLLAGDPTISPSVQKV